MPARSMPAFNMPATFAFIPAGPARQSFRARLGLMVRTAQTRRLLAEMDSRMLADIGATRSEAQQEASRPAWDTSCRSW